MEKVAVAVDKIRDAGKIPGTLVTRGRATRTGWEKGVQFFYIHTGPFPSPRIAGIKQTLTR